MNQAMEQNERLCDARTQQSREARWAEDRDLKVRRSDDCCGEGKKSEERKGFKEITASSDEVQLFSLDCYAGSHRKAG